MHSALTAVAVLCALLALAGAAYFAMCIVAARRFRRECSRLRISETPFTPPISILKSLKGLDPHMYSFSEPLFARLSGIRSVVRRERR